MSGNNVADNIVEIDKNIREKLKKIKKPVLIPQAPNISIKENSVLEALTNDGLYSAEECARILALADGFWEDAQVIMDVKNDAPMRDEEVRNNQNYLLLPADDNFWIFEKLLAIVTAANDEFYQFEINQFNAVQISKYEVGEYYHEHFDIGPGVIGNRKLSLTLQLSDPDSYEGGELVLDFSDFIASRELGSVTIFPSFLKHKVTPVTKGTRYSLVAWISGEHRFK